MANVHIVVMFALSSALCIAVGDVLQQRAANRFAGSRVGTVELITKLLRDQRWRWGAVLLFASIGFQAAALNRGSVLLVQPLLTFALLFALPISARLSHRAVLGREWLWAGLLTAAMAVFVTVGNPQPGRQSASAQTWAAVAAVLGPLLIGCVVVASIWGDALAAVSFAFVSGSLWAVFAVLTRGIVHRLAVDGWAVARTPELYVWLLAALGGVVAGQSAFRAGSLAASMPTLQVSQPVVSAVLGVLVLGETLNTGHVGMLALTAATLVMVAAILKLATVEAVVTRDGVTEARRDVTDRVVQSPPR